MVLTFDSNASIKKFLLGQSDHQLPIIDAHKLRCRVEISETLNRSDA